MTATTSWRPRWPHVSQLYRHAGDAPGALEGASDCFEASLARYLREMAYPFSGDDPALVGAMRLLTTGQADHAGQGYTSIEQGGKALSALGVRWRWAGSLHAVWPEAWSILWVRAARLRETTPNAVDGRSVYTDYPLWWLGGSDEADHFILRLPNGRCNDPLSYWRQGDADYTPSSLASAFAGAYVLDGAPLGSPPTAVHGGGDAEGLVVRCLQGLHLREAPTLAAPVLATLADGSPVRDVYAHECLWTFVYEPTRGLHGWVKREFVAQAR